MRLVVMNLVDRYGGVNNMRLNSFYAKVSKMMNRRTSSNAYAC